MGESPNPDLLKRGALGFTDETLVADDQFSALLARSSLGQPPVEDSQRYEVIRGQKKSFRSSDDSMRSSRDRTRTRARDEVLILRAQPTGFLQGTPVLHQIVTDRSLVGVHAAAVVIDRKAIEALPIIQVQRLRGGRPWQSHEAAAWPFCPSSETLHGPRLLRIVPSE